MREDFVPALDPYTSLMADRMRNRFYMEQMKIGNAIDAIRKPAILGGRPFAPGVAEKLVDDLRLQQSVDPLTTKPILSQFVEPVHLQVVCYQLWQNLKARSLEEITLQDLDELGNIDTALLQFYEQSIARVLQEFKISELELRNWFEQKLITESSTRGTVYEGPTETAGLSNEITHFLINQFILRSETRAGGRWYELVHDRFVGPIQQANKTWWEGQIPLVKTANLWNQSGQPPTLLFREQQLREALETFDWEEGEPVVKNFLEACRDRQNQQTLLVANAQIKAEAERTKKRYVKHAAQY